ncbi:hypothetical protein [Legionella fairfieldensis]|uniref:hypothetical protein n=1 Tax=Legionella fairfieldensis TaxID=45064 RepID=UPI00048ABE26|nr:hypothetical protein [Legionella fairfieldensis]
MKVLTVAHPDDEIIWFSPQDFDLIVIAFLVRHDKPSAEYCRKFYRSTSIKRPHYSSYRRIRILEGWQRKGTFAEMLKINIENIAQGKTAQGRA